MAEIITDLFFFRNSGEASLTKTVPDTITQWVGSAFCSNTQTGFGVAPITYMTAFQPFFVSFTLPYSVVRGEIVPVLVTVFNYLSECMEVGFFGHIDFKESTKEGINGNLTKGH